MNAWEDDWDELFSVGAEAIEGVEPDKSAWESFDFAVEENEIIEANVVQLTPKIQSRPAPGAFQMADETVGQATEQENPVWARQHPDVVVKSYVQPDWSVPPAEQNSVEKHGVENQDFVASVEKSEKYCNEMDNVLASDGRETQVQAVGQCAASDSGRDSQQEDLIPKDKIQLEYILPQAEQNNVEERHIPENQGFAANGEFMHANTDYANGMHCAVVNHNNDALLQTVGQQFGTMADDGHEDPDVAFFNSLGECSEQISPSLPASHDVEHAESVMQTSENGTQAQAVGQCAGYASGWAQQYPDGVQKGTVQPEYILPQAGQNNVEERYVPENQRLIVNGEFMHASPNHANGMHCAAVNHNSDALSQTVGQQFGTMADDGHEDPDVAFFNSLGECSEQISPSLPAAQVVEHAENIHKQFQPMVPEQSYEQLQIYSNSTSGMEPSNYSQSYPVDSSVRVLQSRSNNADEYGHQMQKPSLTGNSDRTSSLSFENVDDITFFDILGDIADGTSNPAVLESQMPKQNYSPAPTSTAVGLDQLPELHLSRISPSNVPGEYDVNDREGNSDQSGGGAYGRAAPTLCSSNAGGPNYLQPAGYMSLTTDSTTNSQNHLRFPQPNGIHPGLHSHNSDPEPYQWNGVPSSNTYWNVQQELPTQTGQGPDSQIVHERPLPNDTARNQHPGYETFFQPSGNSTAAAYYPPMAGESQVENTSPNLSHPRQTCGRPPCPSISFGIGGKVVVMMPKVDVMGSSPGAIEVHSLKSLPSILSQRQREAGLATPHGLVDSTRTALEHFPGPLGSSTNKEKLISYITDRMEYCSREEPDHPDIIGLKSLWGTLKLMVKHPGFIVDRAGKSVPAANKEFVDMLSSCSNWDGSFAGEECAQSFRQEVKGPHDLESIAQQIQKLSSTGNIAEALKVAKSGGLWEIALVLSQFLGQKTFSETASEMATQKLAPNSPLNTLVQIVAGKQEMHSQTRGPLKVEREQADGTGSHGLPKSGSHISIPSDAQALDAWQGHLAMLAANKGSSRRDHASCFGDRLVVHEGKVCAGHLFYLIGGLMPQMLDDKNDCRFALLGWDHHTSSCPSMAAFQCTEILEWVNGVANSSGKIAAFQPYKLLYAWTLAEYGYISEAADYCELVLEAIKSMGSRMPKSLLICATAAKELLERVRQHAAAHQVTLKRSSTLLESFGRILDKGINKLIGVGEGQAPEEALSRRSSVSDVRSPSEVVSSYMRTPSQASFDSSRNITDEYRQRLSPRPPLASHSNYSYQQAVDLSPQWSTSPSPTGQHIPQRKSSSFQGPELYPGNGHQPNDHHQSIPAHSPSPRQGTEATKKGGWLRMLWGGGSQSKASNQSESPTRQGLKNDHQSGFFSNTWGATKGAQDILPPSTFLSWGRSSESSMQGSQGRLSPSSSSSPSRYGSGFGQDGGVYTSQSSATSISTGPTNQTMLPKFFFPQISAKNSSEFEEIAL